MQKLYTKAGKELVGVPWLRYPRPQMVRRDWLCLNGDWELVFDGTTQKIRVPFCPESLLSGVEAPPEIGTGREMVYRRSFAVPPEWAGRRVLLHFGAVMSRAAVRVNGEELCRHENGYLPFTVDITEALREGKNELTVAVSNELDHKLPWGKQRLDRGGMWYTPCSGIWQTVWLEPVPEQHVRALHIRTGEDWAEIAAEGVEEGEVLFDGRAYSLENGTARIPVEDPQLWSPENPRLYNFTLQSGEDKVDSYFALRTLSIETVKGLPRLCLNGKPYFFHGLLDQGYWSDGLYTPATPMGYVRDITAMKRLGFNTLRKHIKLEPEQFYYDCDRLGMIVFQDLWASRGCPTGSGTGIRRPGRIFTGPWTRRCGCWEITPASVSGPSSTRAGASSTPTPPITGCAAWIRAASSTPPPAGSTSATATWTACTSTSAG